MAFRILVVEDDRYQSDLISEVLHHAGYHVEVVETVSDALRRLRQTVFSVVVLDLLLPGSSPRDTFESIRTARVPIVVVTGVIDLDLQRDLVARGVADYLVKFDVTKGSFLRSIERAILQRSPGEG